jgi:hypothetical protein
MPPRKPRPEVPLEDFLAGFVAVLALKGRPRLRSEPGVLDRALAGTVADCAKVAERLRLAFGFRLRVDALRRPDSNLSMAFRALEARGLLVPPGPGQSEYEIPLGRHEAIEVLNGLPWRLELFERAANAFRRRQVMAGLHALATKARGPAPPR